MNYEEKIYIEEYVEEIISLTVEAGYNIDKFGNIVHNNRKETIKQLRNIIESIANESNLDKEQIKNYLIEIYFDRINGVENAQESKEIISLLNDIDAEKNNLPPIHNDSEKTKKSIETQEI